MRGEEKEASEEEKEQMKFPLLISPWIFQEAWPSESSLIALDLASFACFLTFFLHPPRPPQPSNPLQHSDPPHPNHHLLQSTTPQPPKFSSTASNSPLTQHWWLWSFPVSQLDPALGAENPKSHLISRSPSDSTLTLSLVPPPSSSSFLFHHTPDHTHSRSLHTPSLLSHLAT